jgi:hypothetical protein
MTDRVEGCDAQNAGKTRAKRGQKKAAPRAACFLAIELVGGAGFEPATSTV